MKESCLQRTGQPLRHRGSPHDHIHIGSWIYYVKNVSATLRSIRGCGKIRKGGIIRRGNGRSTISELKPLKSGEGDVEK